MTDKPWRSSRGSIDRRILPYILRWRVTRMMACAGVSLLAASCGGIPGRTSGSGTSTRSSGLGTPVVGTDFLTSSQEQAETVISQSNVNGVQYITTAFNDDTEQWCYGCLDHIQYTQTDRFVYPGASLMGYATSQDGGASWTYRGKLSPPSGWAVLWGDPAIARAANNQNYVYMTNLAVPNSKVPGSGYMEGSMIPYIGGACIARSSNAGVSFSVAQCVTNNNDFYDGGSIVVASDNSVYAAFQDVDTNKIDVYRATSLTGSFTRIADPFPGISIESHPRLRAWNGTVYVVSQYSGSHQLVIARYASGVWTHQWINGAYAATESSLSVFPDRAIRFGPQYSFDVVGTSDPNNFDQIIIAYTARTPSLKWYVTTAQCDLDLVDCQAVGGWSTETRAGDQFDPAIAAEPGFWIIPKKWEIMFWSREDNPSGYLLKLMHATLQTDQSGNRYWNPQQATPDQTPCPANYNYWGDYHSLAFLDLDGNLDARFIGTFSDSSQGCPTRWEYFANHLHVSSVVVQ